jgi:hypothetical protein
MDVGREQCLVSAWRLDHDYERVDLMPCTKPDTSIIPTSKKFPKWKQRKGGRRRWREKQYIEIKRRMCELNNPSRRWYRE